MPKRAKMAFVWFTIRVCSVTRFCRSRFRPPRVLLLDGRDCYHAAMALLAAQPTEKGAHQEFGIKAIGLRTPMFARHRDARRMNDISFGIAPPQPARQPEAVSASLISDNNALDLAPSLAGFIAPTMQSLSRPSC